MTHSRAVRGRLLAFFLFPVLVFAVAAPARAPAGEAKARRKAFVVHEWGVHVRGRATVRTWTPGLAVRGPGAVKGLKSAVFAPKELISGLPKFVLRYAKDYKPKVKHRAWDKPVLHFYGPEGLEVSVTVGTPQGAPLAYWPQPKMTEKFQWFMGSGRTRAVAMTWKGNLSFDRPRDVAEVKGEHWWKTVRAVPGRWIKTGAGSERFIFYEATALEKPTLVGRVTRDVLTLSNGGAAASGPVVAIVNDGEARHFLEVADVPAGESVRLARKKLLAAPGEAKALLAACRRQWRAFGMTEKEAAAIVATWRPDLLGRRGFLVISRIPAAAYQKMFPLTVTPKPDELVRAGAVFDTLPGDDGRLAWLPALRKRMQKWVPDLSSDEFKVREAARERLAAMGCIARPLLKELAGHKDPEVSSAAEVLLGKLKTGDVEISVPVKGRAGR